MKKELFINQFIIEADDTASHATAFNVIVKDHLDGSIMEDIVKLDDAITHVFQCYNIYKGWNFTPFNVLPISDGFYLSSVFQRLYTAKLSAHLLGRLLYSIVHEIKDTKVIDAFHALYQAEVKASQETMVDIFLEYILDNIGIRVEYMDITKVTQLARYCAGTISQNDAYIKALDKMADNILSNPYSKLITHDVKQGSYTLNTVHIYDITADNVLLYDITPATDSVA